MSSWQAVVSTVSAWVVSLLVPAAVWSLLGAGIYQLIRDRIRRVSVASARKRGLARESTG